MMESHDPAKMKGTFWMFCAKCDKKMLPAYAYTPKAAREHLVQAHGETQEHVDTYYADDIKVAA